MTTTDRSEYTQGLRQLADILDNNPDLPLPYTGGVSSLNWIQTYGDDTNLRAAAALFTRLVPGTITKNVCDNVMDLGGSVAGLKVLMMVSREAVCKRVVTGTHEVSIEATPAMPARPAEPGRTEVVEDVTWVCGPILAAVDAPEQATV